MQITTSAYDEGLLRFHQTGPEFDDALSNHGPMVIEILDRRGQADQIHRWTDGYLRRLDDAPRGQYPITAETWRESLGRSERVADWTGYLHHELADEPWGDVLARWWPRLIGGIAAGATHGVIRTGHAVRALATQESEPRRAELAHALGYWAARYQSVPVIVPTGSRDASEILLGLPRIAQQFGGVRNRLAQLPGTDGWAEAAAALRQPPQAGSQPGALAQLVDAVVTVYPRVAQANPTMLVHAATALNAVGMVLPHLPVELWADSVRAAWAASAAVFSAYAAPVPVDVDTREHTAPSPADRFAEAVAHGGEHVIKFTDTALTSYDRSGDTLALIAAATAVRLDA